MSPDVVSVVTLPGFCLQAEFETGELRRFDMKPYLDYPAFSALKMDALFERAHVRHGTVAWTDDIDMSPDTLYLKGEAVVAL